MHLLLSFRSNTQNVPDRVSAPTAENNPLRRNRSDEALASVLFFYTANAHSP